MTDIEGAVTIVTGGASGIGRALVDAFLSNGAAAVVAVDVDDDVVAAMGDTGAHGRTVDVSDETQVAALVQQTEDRWGPIDIFASNAGLLRRTGLEESNEVVQRMWEVHVMAHVFAARTVLPGMIERGHGHLLQTASAAGLLSQVDAMAYSVTKAATVALADWLAINYASAGVGVSVLCPQGVATPMTADIEPGFVGELMKPSAVAAACIEAVRSNRFLVLPHHEVAEHMRRKVDDRERWHRGMRRLLDGAAGR